MIIRANDSNSDWVYGLGINNYKKEDIILLGKIIYLLYNIKEQTINDEMYNKLLEYITNNKNYLYYLTLEDTRHQRIHLRLQTYHLSGHSQQRMKHQSRTSHAV